MSAIRSGHPRRAVPWARCSRSRRGSPPPTCPTRSAACPVGRATAIKRTCTPAFAHYLLSRPAEQSPLLSAHPTDAETYRVASVNLAAGSNRVSVSYVSEQDRADTGAFLLTLAHRHGRWLVAALET